MSNLALFISLHTITSAMTCTRPCQLPSLYFICLCSRPTTIRRTRLTKCLSSSQSETHSTLNTISSAWLCIIVNGDRERESLRARERKRVLCLLWQYKHTEIDITRKSVNTQNGCKRLSLSAREYKKIPSPARSAGSSKRSCASDSELRFKLQRLWRPLQWLPPSTSPSPSP